MSDTSPDTDLQSVEKLKAALEKERAEHKATRAQLLAPIRTTLGLGDSASLDDITASLGTRLGDAEKIVADRTASLAAERDEAVAKAAKVEQTWAEEKIATALSAAFEKSGARPEHRDDFMLLTKGLFSVGADGRVVTREGAPSVVPGMDPAQWIQGQLKSMRSFWWPVSVSGGARGGGVMVDRGPDASCFKTGNVTAMMSYIGTHGEQAAIAACRRQGIAPPAWLMKGMVAQ